MEIFKDESREETESPTDVSVIRLIRPDGKLIVESPGDAVEIEERLPNLGHRHRPSHELPCEGMLEDNPIHDCLTGSFAKSFVDPIRCTKVEFVKKTIADQNIHVKFSVEYEWAECYLCSVRIGRKNEERDAVNALIIETGNGPGPHRP